MAIHDNSDLALQRGLVYLEQERTVYSMVSKLFAVLSHPHALYPVAHVADVPHPWGGLLEPALASCLAAPVGPTCAGLHMHCHRPLGTRSQVVVHPLVK